MLFFAGALDDFLDPSLLEDPSLREMHSFPSSGKECSGDFFPDKRDYGALSASWPGLHDAGCMFSMISTSSSSMISTDDES